MQIKGKKIGFSLTGSFYTLNNTIEEMKKIVNMGGEIIPIMSLFVYDTNTKLGESKEYINKIEKITKRKIINSIIETEELISKENIDIMVIAPCTGNTIAKITNGISDTSVTTAAKAYLRNNIPVLIGISAKDGLSTNAENIAKLLNRKHVFFIPFKQSNPITKPYSLSFDCKYIIKSIEYALDNEQIQPILL